MRKMIRNAFLCMLLVLCAVNSGCSFEQYRTSVVNKLTNSSDEQLATIWDAVVNKDAEKIRSLFAKNALDQAQNLDDGIAYILNMPEGEIEDLNDGGNSSGSNNYGEKVLTSNDYKTIAIDGHQYGFYIRHTVTDTKNPDNVGLWTLQIIDMDNAESTLIDPNILVHDYVGIYIGECPSENQDS